MAEFARDTGVAVEVEKFETWDPAGRSFDRHASSVLVAGGLFVALWHVLATPEPVAQAFGDAYRPAADGLRAEGSDFTTHCRTLVVAAVRT